MSLKFDIPEIPAKPKLENKFYIAFMVSDGDNIQYCQRNAMKKMTSYGQTKNVGNTPLAGLVPNTD